MDAIRSLKKLKQEGFGFLLFFHCILSYRGNLVSKFYYAKLATAHCSSANNLRQAEASLLQTIQIPD